MTEEVSRISQIVKKNLNSGLYGLAFGTTINFVLKLVGHETDPQLPYVMALGLTAASDLGCYAQNGSLIEGLKDDLGTFGGALAGFYAINCVEYLANIIK